MNSLAEYKEPVGAFVFHQTHPENIESIRAAGIKHTTEPGSNSTTIDTVLTDLGYDSPFPFDRTTATYCHVDAAYVAETLPSQTDTALIRDEVAIVIDVARITAPMYLADMSLVSDLIDYLHGGADVMLYADKPDQAVERYRDSITLVETPADIASYVDIGVGHAELIMDGGIHPDSIVEIVE